MDSMRDPSTANCRIYLGNLEVNTSKSEIQNIFSKYGNIKGILISRNFGFVQYENEQCVNSAIENEHQKIFKGRKMIVSKVQKKGNQKGNDNKSNAVISEPPSNQNVTNDPTPAQHSQSINDININTSATGNNPPVNLNKNLSNNSINSNINMSNASNSGNNNNNNRNSTNAGGGNNNNNNSNNNNAGNSQQNMGNHSSRPQWRNNRNNNRNMNNSNEMNLQTDRERSPLDGGRNLNIADRRNQDGGGNNSNNNFRNNRTGNNKNNANNNSSNNANNNSNNMNSSSYNQSRNDNNSNFGILQNAGDAPKNVLTGGVLRGFPSAREIRARHPDANDCEIVVMDKQLTDYAEFIENRVRRLGISADLLFPTTNLTCGKMLSNIANRGSLYAIMLSAENKEMKSVTVNILYGIPAEHRNMPLEDAIELIYRNYEDLRQGAKGDIIGDNDESPYASVALASVRHPDSIQHLINLLADNRCLTVLQFDCLLKYLQERRELQYKFELGDTNPDVQMQDIKPTTCDIKQEETSKIEIHDSPKQESNAEEELQKRLLEILSKPSIPNMKVESPISKTILDSKSPTSIDIQEPKLLNDPSLKNALDSLFPF